MEKLNEIVSEEVAHLLKDQGYDESCSRAYIRISNSPESKAKYVFASEGNTFDNSMFREDFNAVAPSIYDVQKWLRNNHKLHTAVYRLNKRWRSHVYDINKQSYVTNGAMFDEYEDALANAIKQALEIL